MYINMYVLETRHDPDDASTSLQIVRCKLVDRLIVRLVARAGWLTWHDRASQVRCATDSSLAEPVELATGC